MWKAGIRRAQVFHTRMPPTSWIGYINCYNVYMLPAWLSFPSQAKKLTLQVAVKWEQLIFSCQGLEPLKIKSHVKRTWRPAQRGSLWPNCDNLNNDNSNSKWIKTLNQQSPCIVTMLKPGEQPGPRIWEAFKLGNEGKGVLLVNQTAPEDERNVLTYRRTPLRIRNNKAFSRTNMTLLSQV